MLTKKISKILCTAIVLGTLTLTVACQKQQTTENKETKVEVKQECSESSSTPS